MKTTLLILLFAGVCFAQIDTTKIIKWSSGTVLSIDTLTALRWQPATQISFKGGFSISWKNKIIEIIYDKNVTPTESIKKFFQWLREYMEEEYYITKKKNLDEILKVKVN